MVTIGTVPWTRQEMVEELKEFSALYQRRPIANNVGGMKSPHLFLLWFVLKRLKPKAVIESGIWFGQGTWLIEQACPDAELHCIDINLDRIRYKSQKAKYYDHDFSTIDWTGLPKEETVLFFDDHQNAYERIKTAKWFGFKHLLFEDNYPPSRGDFYTLRKVLMCSGFTPARPKSTKSIAKEKIASLLRIQTLRNEGIPPNDLDAKYLIQNLEVYYELPPVFKPEKTRWGDTWDEKSYPTPEPLLISVEEEYHQVYLDEAVYYTWMCYAKLK